MQLMCVGGPYHGQKMAVRPDARGFVVPTQQPAFIYTAYCGPTPDRVTMETGLYRIETLGLEHDGISVRMKVLAYYGSTPADRPKDFAL